MTHCACGARMGDPRARRCIACHTGRSDPHAHALKRCGKSLRSIAREAGVSTRTVERAAAGHGLSRSNARRISEVTGVDVRLLVLGRWYT